MKADHDDSNTALEQEIICVQHSSPQVSIQNTQHQHLISICVGSGKNNTEFVNICTPLTTKLMTAARKICPAIIKTLFFWLF